MKHTFMTSVTYYKTFYKVYFTRADVLEELVNLRRKEPAYGVIKADTF